VLWDDYGAHRPQASVQKPSRQYPLPHSVSLVQGVAPHVTALGQLHGPTMPLSAEYD